MFAARLNFYCSCLPENSLFFGDAIIKARQQALSGSPGDIAAKAFLYDKEGCAGYKRMPGSCSRQASYTIYKAVCPLRNSGG